MYENTMAIVLAAGKGTRLHSEQFNLPKVMRQACGKPLLAWVMDALSFMPKENVIIVDGYMKEKVEEAFPGRRFAYQQVQLGTGHAVMAAREYFKDFGGTVMACFGDMPLLTADVYSGLLVAHKKSGAECTLLAGTTNLDLPFGRIVRDGSGGFAAIVEDRDCTPEQKKIRELNVGIFAFKSKWLYDALDCLKTDNAQGEYYLTDVPGIIQKKGGKIDIFTAELNEKIIGVNTQEQLDMVERYLENRKG